MIPPVIIGEPVVSRILLVGQAPGIREGELQRPFAWTAGKTLFKWFATIGVDEAHFRRQVYMTAVCRCFPGKNPKGGDRVPNKVEIANCAQWLNAEVEMLQPELIIPVGKLAISQYMTVDRLVDVIGQAFAQPVNGVATTIIPLPHPSGASTWHQRPPGKPLLQQALNLIEAQPAWRAMLDAGA
ncbi:MAG TPA: uracil-DNA glycosylase [Thiotrichales bacterium]|nr:uracil-DNA glycosylase [Thiotrichales bacterium]